MIDTFSKTYQVRQQDPSNYDDDSGEYTTPTENPISIKATIQRLSAKERLLLPETERTSQTLKVYTAATLNIGENVNSTKGDILEYKGEDYRITNLEDWDDFNENGLEHFRYQATRIDPNPDRQETP